MRPAQITFVAEEFENATMHLLDRFLLGYPRDGEVVRLEGVQIRLCLPGTTRAPAELEQRIREQQVVFLPNLPDASANADGWVIIPRGVGTTVNDAFIEAALNKSGPQSLCFIHGVLGSNLRSARRHLDLARARGAAVLSGTAVSTTWRLPDIDVPLQARLKDSLIVVEGVWPAAEVDGVAGILPWLERRGTTGQGIARIRHWSGPAVWEAGDKGVWSWDLLAAALSRSDSPQGGAVTDGRTENLIALGLVQKLAVDPRAWVIEHTDGLRTAVLVLTGVVADNLVAIQLADGSVLSAQLFRPPKPAQHEFSRLSAHIDDFLSGQPAPWPVSRSLITAGLLEAFATSLDQDQAAVETPELASLP